MNKFDDEDDHVGDGVRRLLKITRGNQTGDVYWRFPAKTGTSQRPVLFPAKSKAEYSTCSIYKHLVVIFFSL